MVAKKRKTFTSEDAAVDMDDDAVIEEMAEAITDNALAVPLFADIDGRTSRSISQLRLLKLEHGGIAYKGMIPLTSTLDTIGQIYGDGIYTLEGLNNRGTLLHSKENVRISLESPKASNGVPQPNSGVEADRIEKLARISANETVENSRQFLQLIVTTSQAQAERDRQFFTTLMSMQDKQYQQTIAMMQLSHNATLQTMQVNRENTPQTDQNQLLETLIRGMDMGREMSSGSEPEPVWAGILKGGIGALSQVSQAQQNTNGAASKKPSKPIGKTLTAAHRRTLARALRLYRVVRSSGVDERDLIAQLSKAGDSAMLEEAPTLNDVMQASRVPPPPTDNEVSEAELDDEAAEQFDEDDSDDELEDDSDDDSDADEPGESASVSATD